MHDATRAERERRLAALSPAKRRLFEGGTLGQPTGEAPRTIERRGEGVPVPLSFTQELLWRLERTLGSSAAYNVPRIVRLRGTLDMRALQHAVNAVVQRHEILRTTFELVEGQPRQQIHPPATVPIRTIRLIESPTLEEREGALVERVRALITRPFDLAAEQQLRVTVIDVAQGDHVVVFESHHIASDDRSSALLLRDIAAEYDDFLRGEPAQLDPLPLQFGDFAVWEREELQGDRLERLFAYWSGRLAGAPASLELPTDSVRPAAASFAGSRRTTVFPLAVLVRLRQLAQANSATLFMTVLAAWNVLLARYSGKDDIVVGSPVTGRAHPELDNVIGYFSNTLLLRSSLASDPAFSEFLAQVRETCLSAYEHQALPYEKLLVELEERGLSSGPLFEVMFAFIDGEERPFELAGTEPVPFSVRAQTAKFDLLISARETGEGLLVGIEYRTDLFDADTIDRMLVQFGVLLDAIVDDPAERLSRLPLLSTDERDRIVRDWNATATPYDEQRSVHELFESQVARAPDAVAVTDDVDRLTYRELNARANRLARYLQKIGVRRGDIVAIAIERSLAMVIATIAVVKAGATYLPIDPEYPQARVEFMLFDACVNVMLTRSATIVTGNANVVNVCAFDAAIDACAEESPANLPSVDGRDAVAYLMYTSGSTGSPKGVLVPHRAINRLVQGPSFVSISSDDTIAFISNVCFDVSTFELWGALTNGARLVIFESDTVLAPNLFSDALRVRRVSILAITTALFREMSRLRPDAFSPLRYVLVAGEALDRASVAAVLAAGGPAHVVNVYGPTEATVYATSHEVSTAEDGRRSIPIGRPIQNTQAYVLDGAGNIVPIGVPGELHLGGPGLANGYLHAPELTARRFFQNPVASAGNGLVYATGDRVRYLPDGEIEYLGRIDHQMKIRGFRVELGEIEGALQALTEIAQAAVIAREIQPGDHRIVAYVVFVPDTPHADPFEQLRATLPGYMIPQHLVVLDAIPVTRNGKIDVAALPSPQPEERATVESPTDPLRARLVKVWEDVLHVRSLGVHDNFFEHGGHSLSAMRMLTEIERLFGERIPMSELVHRATVDHVANLLLARIDDEQQQWPFVANPEGRLTPVFVFLGLDAAANHDVFEMLQRALGANRPLYAATLPDAECEGASPSADRLATRLIDCVRAIRAHGPYLLGGYAQGASGALAVARRLHAGGEPVENVVLIEPEPPFVPPEGPPPRDRNGGLLAFFRGNRRPAGAASTQPQPTYEGPTCVFTSDMKIAGIWSARLRAARTFDFSMNAPSSEAQLGRCFGSY